MTQVYHHALPPGTRIESFEIRGTLGIGAFGITYKAYDHSLDRTVAIKEYLPSDLAVRIADGTTVSPKSENEAKGYHYGLRRFLDEARTLARFHEPHVVRIITYMEAHGTAYFVMDYEEGEPLDKRLKAVGTLPEEEIRAIVLPILRSLRGVHAQNFLHRDIKPGNIYLRRDGSPVLLDFGAARQAIGEHGRTATGMVTPGYAPFEQYLADNKQGPWSDIYALGATMYHCVTGVAPIASTERVAAIHIGEPDPLPGIGGAMKKKYSAALLDTMLWMLRPMPKDRPQTVDEALAALTGTAQVPVNPSPQRHEDAPAVANLDLDSARTLELSDTQPLAPGNDAQHPSAVAENGIARRLRGAAQQLTATMRRWLGDTKRRRLLAAAAGTALAVLIAVVVWLAKPSSTGTPSPVTETKPATEASPPAVAPSSLLKQAESTVAAKNWDKVAQLADDALKENPRNAEALLLKGHIAYLRDRQYATAVRHYDEALRLRPDLKTDARLVSNLVGALDTVGPPAAQVLERHPSPAAAKLVADRAAKPGFAVRRMAVDLLTTWHERKRINEGKRALLDLKEAPDCPQRLQVVVRIRELRLKQALPALKKIADVNLLERVFTNQPNACLFDEAKKTIAVLEGKNS